MFSQLLGSLGKSPIIKVSVTGEGTVLFRACVFVWCVAAVGGGRGWRDENESLDQQFELIIQLGPIALIWTGIISTVLH